MSFPPSIAALRKLSPMSQALERRIVSKGGGGGSEDLGQRSAPVSPYSSAPSSCNDCSFPRTSSHVGGGFSLRHVLLKAFDIGSGDRRDSLAPQDRFYMALDMATVLPELNFFGCTTFVNIEIAEL